MRLLGAKVQWAIRCIGLTMAIAGIVIMLGGYAINPYLAQRDREIFETLSFEDPNWLYYKDIGDAMMVFVWSLTIGGTLIITSLIVAVSSYLVSRGVTFKLKGSNVA